MKRSKTSPEPLFRGGHEKRLLHYLHLIAGCLDEYFGGYSGRGAHIASFSYDQPGMGRLLAGLCRHYLAGQGLPDDVELEFWGEGGAHVRSAAMGAALEAFFDTEQEPFLAHPRRGIGKVDDWNGDERFSYLVGVYLSEFDGTAFRFANARSKVLRTHGFLCEASDEGDKVIWTQHFNLPHVAVLELSEGHELLAALEKQKRFLEGNFGLKD